MAQPRTSPVTVPTDRNRVVDLVRVLALGGVVLGHWLKQGWYVGDGGGLHRAGLLGIATWTHPLTWFFQLIPVFFVVGGYANAVSWRHAQVRGRGYGPWLAARMGRLTRPLLPLLAFWCVVTPLAPYLGLDDDWVRIASKASLVPTWFLATYVVIVALVPLTMAAWERWGVWTLAAGLLALPVDAVSLHSDSLLLGGLNMLLVWGTLHQLGYAWRDGVFRRRAWATLLCVGGLAGTLTLVAVGPYGVSMVGVDGHGVNNTDPPRATILFLGLALAGLVFAAEPALARFAARPRVWGSVVLVERRVMTIYLWHLTALSILGAVSLWLGGLGLHAAPDTAAWWAMRPGWLAALALTTLALVVLVGRFEDPVPAAEHCPAVLPLSEVACTTVFLGLMADRGLGPSEHLTPSWFLVLAAFATLAAFDHLLRQPPVQRRLEPRISR